MPYFRVGFNRPTLQAIIVNEGDTLPEGFPDVGTYFMKVDLDPSDYWMVEIHYTHVRNLLYLRGEQNMQIIKIFLNIGDLEPVDPDPEPEPSVFGNGIWDDNAIWNDNHIWKDHP